MCIYACVNGCDVFKHSIVRNLTVGSGVPEVTITAPVDTVVASGYKIKQVALFSIVFHKLMFIPQRNSVLNSRNTMKQTLDIKSLL